MVITLNGEARELSSEIGLDRLVESLELPAQRLAVELNGSVVRRIDWPTIAVKEGDRVEIVQFVGGG